jgi:hypothetical protein
MTNYHPHHAQNSDPIQTLQIVIFAMRPQQLLPVGVKRKHHKQVRFLPQLPQINVVSGTGDHDSQDDAKKTTKTGWRNDKLC